MSSIAQQAKPIGIGQSELLRIQLMAASTCVKITFPSILASYATGLSVFDMPTKVFSDSPAARRILKKTAPPARLHPTAI